MVSAAELLEYTHELLNVAAYEDYCPNGLQVEGSCDVRRIVTGVTASQALIERAVAGKADLLLVHHGFFWKGEDPRIIGMKWRRIRLLVQNDIGLAAYHLPLDGHSELGNNAQLAKLLDFPVTGRFGQGPDGGIGMHATLAQSVDPETINDRLAQRLEREPLFVAGGDHPIRRIGWCSGGAQGYIEQAAALGLDAYVSGEISEPTVHAARELGIHYFAAGHHATERYGIKALGEHLAARFGLSHAFIDVPNPA